MLQALASPGMKPRKEPALGPSACRTEATATRRPGAGCHFHKLVRGSSWRRGRWSEDLEEVREGLTWGSRERAPQEEGTVGAQAAAGCGVWGIGFFSGEMGIEGGF